MPMPEQQFLPGRGSGGWGAARQVASSSASKVAADVTLWQGLRVSGEIAFIGTTDLITPRSCCLSRECVLHQPPRYRPWPLMPPVGVGGGLRPKLRYHQGEPLHCPFPSSRCSSRTVQASASRWCRHWKLPTSRTSPAPSTPLEGCQQSRLSCSTVKGGRKEGIPKDRRGSPSLKARWAELQGRG